VLKKLGVNVDADRATQARCLETARVCFCFAIHHHPATKHVMPVRMALGVPTIFNLLGPLTNPAGARRQIMGVYDRRFVEPIASALAELGSIRAMVFHSFDGLDELSVCAPNQVAHVEDGRVRMERLNPAELGVNKANMSELVASDLEDAAQIIRDVLSGEDRGPRRDMTVLNAAATLLVAGAASDMAEGIALATDSIDRGSAAQTLEALATLSQS
jgi:anthranilate phosphoribosyltransferase